jgi:Esterase/lipase
MVTNEQIDPIISKKYLDRFAKLYFSDLNNMSHLASPIIGELSGLPDILIQVGSAETMLDDSLRFYKKAKKANVNAKLEIWEDMFHGWHSNAHILKDAENAIISIGKFCRKLLKY